MSSQETQDLASALAPNNAPDDARGKPIILIPDFRAFEKNETEPLYDAAGAEAGVEIVYGGCKSAEEIAAMAREVDPETLLTFRTHVSAEAIGSMTRCRHIIRKGIGFDVVDLKAATERGIYVSNVPDYCVEEVSTHAMMLLLAVMRDLIGHRRRITETGWSEYYSGQPIQHLDGRRLGIVGLGKIGRAMARKAQAFGMKILGYDPYLHDDVFEAFGVERRRQLPEMLADCEAVSLHAPLTAETRKMFGAEQFARMRQGAYFVNTARGGCVDLAGLHGALESGHLGGAGIDVWEFEPMDPGHPIFKMPGLVATAHLAYASERSVELCKRRAIEEALRVLRGERPLNVVNPEVFAHR